jgi:hypothetical protein
MEREDLISILLTFVMGMVAGGYLYLTQVASLDRMLAMPDLATSESFVVVGESYGSCGRDCPQFRVAPDASYRYFYTNASGERALLEDTLPNSLMRPLRGNITARELKQQSADSSVCTATDDGISIRYRITLDGTTYELDSCGTAVDYSSPLWKSLTPLWQHFGLLIESNR